MRQTGNRIITVNKAELIAKIKLNKKNHINEYNKAITAYKEEALSQLAAQHKNVKNGALDAKLNLVTPINNEKNYDKIILMFEMDVANEVELSQSEFNAYIHDETTFAMQANFANATYLG